MTPQQQRERMDISAELGDLQRALTDKDVMSSMGACVGTVLFAVKKLAELMRRMNALDL